MTFNSLLHSLSANLHHRDVYQKKYDCDDIEDIKDKGY